MPPSSSHPPHYGWSFYFQPLHRLLILRQHPLHLGPEGLRVVHFLPVAELVHDHVVDHVLRRKHQKTVEVQIALRRAAPPPRPLVPYRDMSEGHANHFREMSHALRYDLKRPIGQLPYLLLAQALTRGLFFPLKLPAHLLHVALDPAPLLLNQALYLPAAQLPRRAHDDLQVPCDLYRYGLSVGTDDVDVQTGQLGVTVTDNLAEDVSFEVNENLGTLEVTVNG